MKLILVSKPSAKEDGWFGFQDLLISLVLGKQDHTISQTIVYVCLAILVLLKKGNWPGLKSFT